MSAKAAASAAGSLATAGRLSKGESGASRPFSHTRSLSRTESAALLEEAMRMAAHAASVASSRKTGLLKPSATILATAGVRAAAMNARTVVFPLSAWTAARRCARRGTSPTDTRQPSARVAAAASRAGAWGPTGVSRTSQQPRREVRPVRASSLASSLTAPAAKATTSAATAAIAGPSPGASDRAPKECASTARSTAILILPSALPSRILRMLLACSPSTPASCVRRATARSASRAIGRTLSLVRICCTRMPPSSKVWVLMSSWGACVSSMCSAVTATSGVRRRERVTAGAILVLNSSLDKEAARGL
mmetsp:Transcript_27065/g.73145  ORF Transcript_27065/g.73145 Transcript_27065/m.73145 type:complete len:307 (+) Transcript_27065:1495-2415(+)